MTYPSVDARNPRLQSLTPTVGLSGRARLIKRAFDLAICTLGLLFLAPMFVFIALWIRADSPGPVFYKQPRGGEHGKGFLIYKFRTMTIDADDRLANLLHLNVHSDDPRLYKLLGDPRVTRFGAILRRTSLDELPQLVNVLKGEMSLVGPRPLMMIEDHHVQGPARLRSAVKPGITGPWQVAGGNELPFEDMMRLDHDYVVRWSFLRDLQFLALTPLAILRRVRIVY
jgi:lipopolysaccharide/colanic/teichoic acid biosynthesis glycosyltransferase